METLRLGKSELIVSRVAFGALPIQRVDADTASAILHRALEGGVTFFDTARFYTDSEEKIQGRLTQARRECERAKNYDYVVLNDDPDRAAEEMRAIILAEKCKMANRKQYLNTEVSQS